MERKVPSTQLPHLPETSFSSRQYETVHFWHWLRLLYVCHFPAYEDEDELLWSPGVIPESKVRSFLLDVLSRTTDEKPGYDKPGIHVRDNEQVSNVCNPSFVAQ